MTLEHFDAHHPLIAAYDAFTRDLFGFDLSGWRDQGHARKVYRTFSFVEADKVIANVSAMEMSLTLDGRRSTGIQLGSVGVREEHRGKGFTHHLMEEVFASYPLADFFYLLSDDPLIPFYEKHGFTPLKEQETVVDLGRLEPKGEWSPVSSVDPRFWSLYENNVLKSRLFDSHDNRGLYQFHLSIGLGECAYELKGRDLVILAEVTGDTLEVYDLIGSQMITGEALLSHLTSFGAKRARFHFMPDALEVGGTHLVCEEDVFFFKGNFPLVDRPFKSPLTGRT